MVEAPTDEAVVRAKVVILEAIKRKNIDACIKIVRAGFSVDTKMEVGMTILMFIAGEGTAQMINQFLVLAPDVNAKDDAGRTALHFAARAGNLETFQVLVALDETDLDPVTNSGMTPLMNAVESGIINMVAEALNSNLNPFLKDALDRTALSHAMQYRGVLGNDMRSLIQGAMQQWITQTSEEDRTGE